jgi:hypothetical protein
VEIEMPQLLEATAVDDPLQPLLRGLDTLRRYLWSCEDPRPKSDWRALLLKRLQSIRPTVAVTRLVESLPEPPSPARRIHGDATLANLLYDSARLRWIWCDPLDRPYIPGDPLVDLGKMLQSCWSYERVLVDGAKPMLDEQMAASVLESGCEADRPCAAMAWCYVHLIRLLPYQSSAVAKHFVEVLDHVGL